MLSIKRHLRSEKGFTMIEMMVVLIIIAVLIAGGIALYRGYIDKAKITKAESFLSTAAGSLDAYYEERGEYPDDSEKAGVYVNDVKDPWGGTYSYQPTKSSGSSVYDGYTLKTTGGKKVNVQATGDKGVSKIEVMKNT